MSEPVPPGTNPRHFLSRHKERGPKKWIYSYKSLAKQLGMTVAALQQAVHRGKVDPSSLKSIILYYNQRFPAKD